MNIIRASAISLMVLGLVGCLPNANNSDLDAYIENAKNQDHGEVKPLEDAKAYEAFVYKVFETRSPFVPEIKLVESNNAPEVNSAPAPDKDRPKQALEFHDIDGLNLVGTYQLAGQTWALIEIAASGDIARVQVGNYIGKDNGKITFIQPSEGRKQPMIRLVETVSSGSSSWLKRPRVLFMKKD